MASLLNMSGGSLLGKGLPYDAEIEFLEVTGTQWIDTGVYGDLYTRSVLRFNPKIYSCVVFGDRTSATENNHSIIIGRQRYNEGIFVDFGSYLYTRLEEDYSIINSWHECVNSNSYRKIENLDNGVISESTSEYNHNFTTPHTLKLGLFTNGFPMNFTNYKGKFGICQIYENGVLIRNLIPVRKGNVGYMYDKVSGQLFGNAGTGDFILGQDKTN